MMQVMMAVILSVVLFGAAHAQGIPDEIAEPYVAYTEALEARDFPVALEAAEQAWRAAKRLDFDPETTATLADNYAMLASALGEHEAARDAYREVAQTLTELDGSAFIIAETWILAARAALAAGDNRDAIRCADTAGDLIENVEDIDAQVQAELTFSSRAIHSNALWLQGRMNAAAMRAQEAMTAAEGFDLADNQSYGMMTFILGAVAAMERRFDEAAFRLTQAYVYVPEQREFLELWVQYARGELDERAQAALLDRIAASRLMVDALPPQRNAADNPWSANAPGADSRVDAAPLDRRPPRYPGTALMGGFTGIALVQFSVDEEGRTADAEVLISIPYSDFGEAALRAVRRWRYTPATVNGVPVVREGVVTQLEFVLAE